MQERANRRPFGHHRLDYQRRLGHNFFLVSIICCIKWRRKWVTFSQDRVSLTVVQTKAFLNGDWVTASKQLWRNDEILKQHKELYFIVQIILNSLSFQESPEFVVHVYYPSYTEGLHTLLNNKCISDTESRWAVSSNRFEIICQMFEKIENVMLTELADGNIRSYVHL